MSRLLIITVILALVISSCEKKRIDGPCELEFSNDTIFFDTVFTSTGSATKELRVKNTGKSRLVIDKIYLAGGSKSPFRLNIDGEPALSRNNIEIYSGDSIFIFVDVIIDPLNSDLPVLVTDSIIFETEKTFRVILHAFGQDVILLKNNHIIRNETWNLQRPYLIYGDILVDTLNTLTIEEGVRILFHKNSSLTVAGNIIVNGTVTNPVLFASDRLEKMYEDVPGQWKGIFFSYLSKGNVLNHTIIRNSTFGIRLGEPDRIVVSETPDIKLNCVNISHSTITDLAVYSGSIEAVNSVFSHAGKYCAYLISGGNYSFIHCTFYNRWEYGIRLTPLLLISPHQSVPKNDAGEMNLYFLNSVVYGDLSSEIQVITDFSSQPVNYCFDHCLIRLDTATSSFWKRDRFIDNIVNRNPRFIDEVTYDFRPDTLSPLINAGNEQVVNTYPNDFRGATRLKDGLPDIGAFERIPGEKKRN
ncbi:MAG TPA: choice-of-anchor Q domain-containing protein [Bacteroidales bacterium]|nr:choice-of-anchor Q domain-containing protein [Bacteroidales bacterium]HOK74562.1 choice-of-anchor Q domain-containing protein [Bacteroidales bacterium]HOM41664.1 choice-of-anchor Q domain-containing protein [Bacteroidales bacterium]HPP92684.1 choice-of-anchor Q domain-containing protein [Bacteroidales bacterium]HRR16512.1 choice-of-anchor Q domain-containing protein [Bacteroidales bacterium]